MKARTLVTAAVAIIAMAVVGGAVAVVQGDGPTATGEAPVSAVLAEGAMPGGETYKIAAIDSDAPSTSYCYEMAVAGQGGQGCVPVPASDETTPWPRKTTLGTHRFVTSLTPTAIATLRIVGPDDGVVATSEPPISVESGRHLLVAMWDGPVVTSENPEPNLTVEYLGADGEMLGRESIGD